MNAFSIVPRTQARAFSHFLRIIAASLVSVTCVSLMASMSGCFSVKTEHRIEPIQITMDVNVRLERELEESFGALDARSRQIAEQHAEKGAE